MELIHFEKEAANRAAIFLAERSGEIFLVVEIPKGLNSYDVVSLLTYTQIPTERKPKINGVAWPTCFVNTIPI